MKGRLKAFERKEVFQLEMVITNEVHILLIARESDCWAEICAY